MTLCGLCRTSSTGYTDFLYRYFKLSQYKRNQQNGLETSRDLAWLNVLLVGWLVGWVQTEPVLLEASCLRGWRRKAGCQRSASWRKYEPQNSSFRAITLATPDHTYYKHCPTAPPSATHQDLSPLSCALTKAGWLKFQD